jgi:hypothetical protein
MTVTHRSKSTMLKHHFGILVGLLLMAAAHFAYAQQYPDQPPGQRIGTPVYDPISKKYYALMHVDPRPFWNQYDRVEISARSASYGGVQGRLAIVDTLEVHDFLLKTFAPGHYQYIWIGLRYLCVSKKLKWSDGHYWKPGDFQIWDAKWNQDVFTCSDKNDPNDWAPISYSPSMQSWIAKGRGKGWEWYFVEFPTGKP